MKKTSLQPSGILTRILSRLLGRNLNLDKSNNQLSTVVDAGPSNPTKGLIDTQFRSNSYIASNRRKIEVETEKAMLIALSRHDKWKAGGPV